MRVISSKTWLGRAHPGFELIQWSEVRVSLRIFQVSPSWTKTHEQRPLSDPPPPKSQPHLPVARTALPTGATLVIVVTQLCLFQRLKHQSAYTPSMACRP